MSTDTKLSKAKLSKIIKSGRFLGALLSKFAGPLMKVAVSLAQNVLGSIVINFCNKWCCSKQNTSKICCKSRKRNHLVISNEDMDDISQNDKIVRKFRCIN